MSFSLALVLSAGTSIATLLAIGAKTLMANQIGKVTTKSEKVSFGF
jgi:hypothetical protein